MNYMQLYFTIGIPTFSILVGILVGFFQSMHVLNQLNLRITSLESSMNARFSSLESRMNLMASGIKTLVRASNDLDVRLARFEERLTR